ncbi:MAG: hypothetical protein ACYDGR_03605 [Candidatus Dormibacteria bacterium]
MKDAPLIEIHFTDGRRVKATDDVLVPLLEVAGWQLEPGEKIALTIERRAGVDIAAATTAYLALRRAIRTSRSPDGSHVTLPRGKAN